MPSVHDLTYNRREYHGEVNGEGVVHACAEQRWGGYKTACGWECEDLGNLFTVDSKSAVTCFECIASGKRF